MTLASESAREEVLAIGRRVAGIVRRATGDPRYRAFCIFFGPTPASQGDEIRPASPVNVVRRVDGDPMVFRKVRAGARVRLERADAAEGA